MEQRCLYSPVGISYHQEQESNTSLELGGQGGRARVVMLLRTTLVTLPFVLLGDSSGSAPQSLPEWLVWIVLAWRFHTQRSTSSHYYYKLQKYPKKVFRIIIHKKIEISKKKILMEKSYKINQKIVPDHSLFMKKIKIPKKNIYIYII